ncbi:hypothetical protein HYU16_00840 [Candidatus Woesearchaeota archaeon]|nr:hypothetical protein [Candidatus Woesearchaeota archaeon]
MVNVPIHIGALDGIMTLTGMPKNFSTEAKVSVNNDEMIKLAKRNFILFSSLTGNACGGMAKSW